MFFYMRRRTRRATRTDTRLPYPTLFRSGDSRKLWIRKAERRLRLGERRAAGGKRRLAEYDDLHRNALAGEVDRMRPAICHRGERDVAHPDDHGRRVAPVGGLADRDDGFLLGFEFLHVHSFPSS